MTMTLTGSGTGTVGVPNSGTAQNSTSGTSIDFTGIPAGIKRITVMFSGVSQTGAGNSIIVQIGYSGGVATSGYAGAAAYTGGSTAGTSVTNGFCTQSSAGAADSFTGIMTIALLNSSTNLWVANFVGGFPGSSYAFLSGGGITLSGVLDRVRVTTNNGTDTFDAGSINILYE